MQVYPDKIVWDQQDFLAGISPFATQTSSTFQPMTLGRGASWTKNFNPYKGAVGAASPGDASTAVTDDSKIAALVTGGALLRGSTPYAYVAGGRYLHKIDYSTTAGSVVDDATWPQDLGSGATADFCINYDAKNSSTLYSLVFYSWNDGTDGDVGIVGTGIGPDDDFMSTVPSGAASLSKAYKHPMCVGTDGILYIGNGRDIASYDGTYSTDGKFTAQAKQVPAGFEVVGFAKDETRELLVIFANRVAGATTAAQQYYRGDAWAFFWDMVSPKFQQAVNLNDNYVNGAFTMNGVPGCFTTGRDGFVNSASVRLRLFNGRTFDVITQYIGAIPGPSGVEVVGDTVFWNDTGRVFSYGYRGSNELVALHQISSSQNSSPGALGMLRNFSGNNLYIGAYGTTNDKSLERVNSSGASYNASTFWFSGSIEPIMQGHKKCQVKSVKIYFTESATGGRALTLSLVTDKGGVTTPVFSALETVASAATILEYVEGSSGRLPVFSDVALRLEWSTGSGSGAAPKINRVEVYYEPYSI